MLSAIACAVRTNSSAVRQALAGPAGLDPSPRLPNSFYPLLGLCLEGISRSAEECKRIGWQPAVSNQICSYVQGLRAIFHPAVIGTAMPDSFDRGLFLEVLAVLETVAALNQTKGQSIDRKASPQIISDQETIVLVAFAQFLSECLQNHSEHFIVQEVAEEVNGDEPLAHPQEHDSIYLRFLLYMEPGQQRMIRLLMTILLRFVHCPTSAQPQGKWT
jgi:hypothetical protein